MTESSKDDVYKFLEYLYSYYNNKEYIFSDPIRFPHEIKGNKEFIAFTAASFAYGNMKAIQGFLYKYFEYEGSDPFKLNTAVNDNIYYRFQTKEDVAEYSLLMKRVYEEYGSIFNLFKKADALSVENIHKGIILLRSHIKHITNGLNFLLPVPGKSASKRLYMFLRWMVRCDDVDFGLWEGFNKQSLYMPADTHILRMSANLGIIGDNEKGKKAVIKVTDFFKGLNINDPAKYDFSLTRLGIISGCKYSRNDICEGCVHKKVCIFH